VIDVVAAIIEHEGRYLACRRRPERGGLWEFPGGKVEQEENANEALAREIHEELDIDIATFGLFTTVELVEQDLRLLFIHAQPIDMLPIASTDHDRLEWLGIDQLASVDWASADRVAVDRLVRFHHGESIIAAVNKDDAELVDEVD
jgi:8-oxo-dGTP diphosphatase